MVLSVRASPLDKVGGLFFGLSTRGVWHSSYFSGSVISLMRSGSIMVLRCSLRGLYAWGANIWCMFLVAFE